jgi:hypothetical protein
MPFLFVIIKALGLIMAAMGVAFAIVPKKMAKILHYFKHGKRMYIVGIVRLVFATIFLLAASQCRWPWFIGILGILTLVSGVLIFSLKLKVLRSVLDWFSGLSKKVMRITGGIVVIIGVLIIFAV